MKRIIALVCCTVLLLGFIITGSLSAFSDELTDPSVNQDEQIYSLPVGADNGAIASKPTGDIGLIASAAALVSVMGVVMALKSSKRKR